MYRLSLPLDRVKFREEKNPDNVTLIAQREMHFKEGAKLATKVKPNSVLERNLK